MGVWQSAANCKLQHLYTDAAISIRHPPTVHLPRRLCAAGLKRSEQLLQDLYFPYSAADIGAKQYQATFAIHTQTNKYKKCSQKMISVTVLVKYKEGRMQDAKSSG